MDSRRMTGFLGYYLGKLKMIRLLVAICLLSASLYILMNLINTTSLEQSGIFETSQNKTKHTTVFFLKTHKCASSTMQNILMRFGEKYHLNFALGSGGNYLGSPSLFRRGFLASSLLPAYQDGLLDIFCHHTRLNVQETTAVLKPDAFWLTIVRDPVDLFESAYDYYGLESAWKISLKDFASLPLQEKHEYSRVMNKRIGANQMTFDMGYDLKATDSAADIAEMVAEIDSYFDLVMVAENMDESLALVQHQLGWDLDDVVYLVRNARRPEHKVNLTRQERELLYQFLKPDQQIYDHFRRKLAKQIVDSGVWEVTKRAEDLVSRRLQLQEECLAGEIENSELPKNQREFSNHVQMFRTSHSGDWLCKRLNTPELVYTNLIRELQIERLKVSKRIQRLVEGHI